MNKASYHLLILALIACCGLTHLLTSAQTANDEPIIPGFRPPAVPLIVFDPFMSIWSMADNLYDTFPQLWCGNTKALTGAIRVDGKPYRFMGPGGNNGGIPVADVISQQSVTVKPTQTYYVFANDQVTLRVTFTTSTIPSDLDLLSQPVTYITYNVSSNDGQDHQIDLYFDQTAEIAIFNADEEVDWSRADVPNGPKYVMSMGTTAQNILGKSGDCDAINWGYAYIAVNSQDDTDNVATAINAATVSRQTFVDSGTIPTSDDTRKPRSANDNWPVMAVSWNFKVTASQNQSRYLIFAYDDIQSIDYFGTRLPPYWRRNNQTVNDVLANATRDYNLRLDICSKYDEELITDLYNAAGAHYSTIGALAFRQAFGGTKLVWNENITGPWFMLKEISSDGDLQTVDVFFPASPLFFYTNPYLMELMLLPILAYANNETSVAYNLAWAPHHLGTYPIGDLPPSKQENMPIEESGNMLMIVAALVKFSKQQGKDYVSQILPRYTALIESWAQYLISGEGVLPDPDIQLCSDDYLGPFPHNTNLAIKGIVGLACYAEMLKLDGDLINAAKYLAFAEAYTQYWMKNALDGDHYKLRYDQNGTWSMKYNLYFQYVLGVEIFPKSIIENEIAYYMNNDLNAFGIPVNNQIVLAKLDWQSFTFAMAPNQDDRLEIYSRIYEFAISMTERVPLPDKYNSITADKGNQARPAVGAFYAYLLLNSLEEGNINQVYV